VSLVAGDTPSVARQVVFLHVGQHQTGQCGQRDKAGLERE
jgi:hypothetical protein